MSIRHGGTQLGAANEINGLTLGGVGSGTIIEQVEVVSNDDDGIEFFGGSVNVRYASVMFCGDDSFDWDQGYHGKGQFWFTIQGQDAGDRGGELDGDDSLDVTADGMPFALPTVANWTVIGRGSNVGNQGLLSALVQVDTFPTPSLPTSQKASKSRTSRIRPMPTISGLLATSPWATSPLMV